MFIQRGESGMKTETFSCDICKSTKAVIKEVQLQVIFLTEQTEGRGIEPYLSNETFDICKTCLQKRLEGKSIYGNGAQGYNNYYFKKEKSE